MPGFGRSEKKRRSGSMATGFARKQGNISRRSGNVRMRSIPVVPGAKTGTRTKVSRGEPNINKPTVRIGGNSDKRGKA